MRGEDSPPGSVRGNLVIVEGDITEQEVDAIVNPANPSLLGGGGADGAIHRAAGPGLREECRLLGGCRTGEAKITGGHRLPARYVIHTVGPVWHGGSEGEDDLLAGCYRSSLLLAGEQGLVSIAFPSIGTGAYGFPFGRAARIAVATVLEVLQETPSIERVNFVCHRKEAAAIYRRVVSELLPQESPSARKTVLPATERASPGRKMIDRIEAHLVTIESAYGIRISNFAEVMDRIGAATGDEQEILAITTAISSYIAANLRHPEMEIPGPFLDRAIRRFAGEGDGRDMGGNASGSSGIIHK